MLHKKKSIEYLLKINLEHSLNKMYQSPNKLRNYLCKENMMLWPYYQNILDHSSIHISMDWNYGDMWCMVLQPKLIRIHFRNNMRLEIHLNQSLCIHMNNQDRHQHNQMYHQSKLADNMLLGKHYLQENN